MIVCEIPDPNFWQKCSFSSMNKQSTCIQNKVWLPLKFSYFCHFWFHREELNFVFLIISMIHDMTKPTKWVCAQRRLRSAWASAQSDQSSLCAQWVAKDPWFLHADSKDSDQTGRMPRLIWVFAGRTLICWFCHVAAHMAFWPIKMKVRSYQTLLPKGEKL